MKITTAGMELLDTRTFLAIGLGETVVTLDHPEPLRLLLDFVEDGSKQTTLGTQGVDQKTLRLILTNWHNPLGGTLLEPVHIGTYQGRQLYILFHIAKAGQKGELRLVTLSLYLGEKGVGENGDN